MHGRCPSKKQRAQETPGARRTRSPACEIKQSTRANSPQVHRTVRRFLRNGFTAYSVLSPGTGLFCPRHQRKLPSADLTPASGRQDHTALPSALAPFVEKRRRVHRIQPRVRDDRDTPLGGVDGETYRPNFHSVKQKYFCKQGLTRGCAKRPDGQISWAREQLSGRCDKCRTFEPSRSSSGGLALHGLAQCLVDPRLPAGPRRLEVFDHLRAEAQRHQLFRRGLVRAAPLSKRGGKVGKGFRKGSGAAKSDFVSSGLSLTSRKSFLL